jgi:hypothetical protein
VLLGRLAADQGDNPVALQDALIEMEKDQGPSHWIGSKIPTSISSSKIWRTVFWVRLDSADSPPLLTDERCYPDSTVMMMYSAFIVTRGLAVSVWQ